MSMPGGETRVRQATANDLARVVRVHVAAFPDFFMTRLGRRFLRAYYGMVMAHPRGILLVADTAEGVQGFIAGFTDPGRFYTSMRLHATHLSIRAVVGIVRRPGLWPRLVRTAQGVVRPRAVFTALPDSCELASLGVSPSYSGKGMGQALVAAFMALAFEQGATHVYLTTAEQGNDRVNRFYRRLGFLATGAHISSGGESKVRYEAVLPWRPPEQP
ncbi:MAG: GNAT family N-acetyltransferase [Armatimonadetes bacterium]|nr:GNAT family N-acetyltransferase [Armatimonadota bacterium]